MHDVFGVPFGEIADTVGRSPAAVRQLASQARRQVREQRAGTASREQHDAVARAFAAATMTGDLEALVAVLDPDVVLRSDGGGRASAALRPVHGADRVSRFLLGLPRLEPDAVMDGVETPDGLGFLATLARPAQRGVLARRARRPHHRRLHHAQPRQAHPVVVRSREERGAGWVG